jgi:hypothetical protein
VAKNFAQKELGFFAATLTCAHTRIGRPLSHTSWSRKNVCEANTSETAVAAAIFVAIVVVVDESATLGPGGRRPTSRGDATDALFFFAPSPPAAAATVAATVAAAAAAGWFGRFGFLLSLMLPNKKKHRPCGRTSSGGATRDRLPAR